MLLLFIKFVPDLGELVLLILFIVLLAIFRLELFAYGGIGGVDTFSNVGPAGDGTDLPPTNCEPGTCCFMFQLNFSTFEENLLYISNVN
jgi:hypothetical protein